VKLADQLGEDALVVSLEGTTPADLLRGLLRATFPDLEEGRATRIAGELAQGRGGEALDAGKARIWASQVDFVDSVTVALGVATEPFGEGDDPKRILVALLTPRRISALREQALPALARFFRNEENAERTIRARTAYDLRAFGALMELELSEHLIVADAMREISYRVYPETPFAEIVDLMVRRTVHAIPVVGHEYEFMGLITTGDALEFLLPRFRKGERPDVRSTLTAGDVMTRSVMCVSEDQSLVDAANSMVNRDVEQIPVVREGELVGMIDRNSVLRMLLGQTNIAADLEKQVEALKKNPS